MLMSSRTEMGPVEENPIYQSNEMEKVNPLFETASI